MRRISPQSLHAGDLIGIAAPSTLIDPELLLNGVKKLSSWGYSVTFDDRILARYRSFAGVDDLRARVLLKLAQNENVRAIWCARGGYGATRILPLLDDLHFAAAMEKKPKLLIGYSDATALHLYAYKKLGLKSLHAPLVATPKWQQLPPATGKVLRELLSGHAPLGARSYTTRWPTRLLAPIKKPVEGILLGGNLTLIANMAGTRWQPSFRGALLFLEDCGEAPYRLDRMLTHLWNTGMLKGVKAVITGDLTADVTLKPGESKSAWKEVLADRLLARGVPVLAYAPVGHGVRNEPLPLGVKARITTRGKLELLEQVTRA